MKKQQFNELDEGPDGYEDDITYTSYVCTKCKIYCHGWSDNWYEEDTRWTDIDGINPQPLFTSEQYEELAKRIDI
jgi:sucrose-6-phosphate hydrolase SacC (GH32 family)